MVRQHRRRAALGRKVQWSVTCSVAAEGIISNNSYAHDEHGGNPGQVRGSDGVLYKL